MKIYIVTPEKSWFFLYAKLLEQKLSVEHAVKLVHSHQEVGSQSDIAFYLSYPKIVAEQVLQHATSNIVVHASDLPKNKGMSPWVWDILSGSDKIVITLFEMVKELDDGDYYFKSCFKLDGSELLDEIRIKLGSKIVEMCLTYVDSFNSRIPHKQVGLSTYCKLRTHKDSELDIHKSIVEQFNLLRVVDNDNYPAFFEYLGNKYILKVYKHENN